MHHKTKQKTRAPARPLNILLTNGRFPTTIDLARQLHLARHTVTVVDPMHYHVCRFSRAVRKSIHVPAPHVDPAGYTAAVAAAVASEHIDLIIPMHEETFHLAASRDPAILHRLFAPPLRHPHRPAQQIALDLVDVEGRGVVAIECNPRATSGIHLFSRTGELADALVGDGDGDGVREARPGARRQLMPGMLMWDRSGGYVAHMKRLVGSKDVLFSTRDLMPSLMQPFLLTSYYRICQERRMKLPEMFQWDLTWEPEGEELGRVRARLDGFVQRGMQPVASVGA